MPSSALLLIGSALICAQMNLNKGQPIASSSAY
jgi:hypothetical protein